MITHLLDRRIRLYRLSQVSGNKTAYSTLTSSIEVARQPLTDEKSAFFDGSHGKTFVFFVDEALNIKESDQIRDYEGNIYKIKAGGIEKRDDGLMASYMRIVVDKVN